MVVAKNSRLRPGSRVAGLGDHPRYHDAGADGDGQGPRRQYGKLPAYAGSCHLTAFMLDALA
jgi:hypothetical protein